jgi:hypothetical protein
MGEADSFTFGTGGKGVGVGLDWIVVTRGRTVTVPDCWPSEAKPA